MPRWALFGDRPTLTPDERKLVLRAMAVIAIPLASLTLLVVGVGGWLIYEELSGRSAENLRSAMLAQDAAEQAALLAIRLDEERQQSQREIVQQAYDNCVENENQDAANVTLFRKVHALVAEGPPSAARDALLDALQETSDAREPPGETDCVPPGTTP